MRIVKLLQRFFHWLWNGERHGPPLTPEQQEEADRADARDATYW